MDPTNPSAPEDLSKLSDEELVQRYCGPPPDKASFEVLWRRYEPKINQRALGFANRFPKGLDHDPFDQIVSEVAKNLVRRVCKFESRKPFSHFVNRLISNSAVDVWRRVTHGRIDDPPPPPVSWDELETHEQEKAMYESTAGNEDEDRRLELTPEGKKKLNQALGQHHPEDPESSETIKAHFKKNRKVKTLAARSGKSEDEILQILSEDLDRLRIILRDELHVESIRQLFEMGGA